MPGSVQHTLTQEPVRPVEERRAARRRQLSLAGQLTWREADGTERSAQIRTRDVSRYGAFIDCVGGCGDLPLYRLVELRLDEAVRNRDDVPTTLKQPRVPAAVYRVGEPKRTNGLPDGYALRLLVKPARRRRKTQARAI